MLRSPLALLALASAGLCLVSSSRDAYAADADGAAQNASQQITTAVSGVDALQQSIQTTDAQTRSAAQRIADAVLLVGSKDYGRAATLLNEVVEKYPEHPTAYADALGLLGEVYYRSKQLLSARRVFRQIVGKTADPRFRSYQEKAIGRLVDIALHTKDFASLDDVFASMSKVSSSAAGSGLAYARGKALFVRKSYADAKAALATVDERSEYVHQARYMMALIALKQTSAEAASAAGADGVIPSSKFAGVIDQFTKVAQLPPDTPEHRRVIDLAWMAVGRIFYETSDWNQAVTAYNHVDRTSPEFGTMLYELAWVYVRLGDSERAQRALEVLAVADPNGQNIAEGTLLRGDLMLRSGQFEKSLRVYEGVRATYEPMRAKVDSFLGSTRDPAVYYDKLSQEQLDTFDSASILPPLAIQWAREAEDGPTTFALLDDVSRCRELVRASNDLIERLNAVLNAPNRVRAFPELRANEERALSLINRIGLARLSLGEGMDLTSDDALGGEIGSWRSKRRALEKRLALLPVNEADFQSREDQAMRQWNSASQSLQRLTLQIDTMQATINGLRRVIRDSSQGGVVRDPATVTQFEQNLGDSEREVTSFKRQIDDLHKMIEAGRVQVGFGDQRFVEDEQVRKDYREALTKEVEFARVGQGGARLQAYAEHILPLISNAATADQRIEGMLRDMEGNVRGRSKSLQDAVSRETMAMVGYQIQLDELDKQARLVVGQVAMRNFGLVRDRMRNILLRADVGITEEAWEVREEQRTRVRNLQVERSREDRLLKEELNEVLDDSGEPETDADASKQPKKEGEP